MPDVNATWPRKRPILSARRNSAVARDEREEFFNTVRS